MIDERVLCMYTNDKISGNPEHPTNIIFFPVLSLHINICNDSCPNLHVHLSNVKMLQYLIGESMDYNKLKTSKVAKTSINGQGLHLSPEFTFGTLLDS